MKQTIEYRDFVREFEDRDRARQLGGRKGLRLLFQYLEDLESDTGEEMELDVIGLCCDYACSTVEEIAENYGLTLINTRDMTEDECTEAVMDYLNERTSVVGVLDDGRILYQQF